MSNVIQFPAFEDVYEMSDDCPKCRVGVEIVVFSSRRLDAMYCPACGERLPVKPVTDDPPEAA